MTVLLWMLVVLAGGLLVAALRRPLEGVLRAASDWPASVLGATSDGLGRSVGVLARAAGHVWDSLAYGDAPDGKGTTIWDVIGPAIYAALFAVLLAGDVILAGLRFAALLGIEIAALPVSGTTLDILTGVLFIAVLTTMGATWLDVQHATPVRRPYGLLNGPMRTAVSTLASTGTALSAVAGLLFLVWGQGALGGEPSSDLATLFVAVFGVLLVAASVLAFGGAVPILAVAVLAVLLVVGFTLAVAQWAADVVIVGLQATLRLLVHLVRLLARPGELLWNWIADGVGRKVGFDALPTPDPTLDDTVEDPRHRHPMHLVPVPAAGGTDPDTE